MMLPAPYKPPNRLLLNHHIRVWPTICWLLPTVKVVTLGIVSVKFSWPSVMLLLTPRYGCMEPISSSKRKTCVLQSNRLVVVCNLTLTTGGHGIYLDGH